MEAQYKKDFRLKAGAGILLTGLMIIGWYVLNAGTESTDNATIQCEWSDVIPEIRGVIKQIRFADDQKVELGETVVLIEDGLYKARLEKSESELHLERVALEAAIEENFLAELNIDGDIEISKSSLESALKRLSSLKLDIEATRSELEIELSNLIKLKADFERGETLYGNNYISKKNFEDVKHSYDSATSNVERLKSKLASAKENYEAEIYKVAEVRKNSEIKIKSEKTLLSTSGMSTKIAKSKIQIAQANRDMAKIDFDRTKIAARRSGYITNRQISVGQYVEIGQPIASIVSCQNNVWVEANFKETQIKNISRGQDVNFSLDAYPGIEFTGVVESISDGSGSTFSVLPPENATGNFTKVVKRFTTRINVKETHGLPMRIGMSAIVNVKVEDS